MHLERIVLLENKNAVNECNKCNDRKCNDRKCNNDRATSECSEWCNPFDFRAIHDHYDRSHYWDNDDANANKDDVVDDECPALDLISNHYADFVPGAGVAVVSDVAADVAVSDASDDMADDDLFELIQIESFHLPTPPK